MIENLKNNKTNKNSKIWLICRKTIPNPGIKDADNPICMKFWNGFHMDLWNISTQPLIWGETKNSKKDIPMKLKNPKTSDQEACLEIKKNQHHELSLSSNSRGSMGLFPFLFFGWTFRWTSPIRLFDKRNQNLKESYTCHFFSFSFSWISRLLVYRKFRTSPFIFHWFLFLNCWYFLQCRVESFRYQTVRPNHIHDWYSFKLAVWVTPNYL